jgi:ketosteroid isomerase-like protein
MKLLLVLCIIFPFTAFAQNWTADQQEVLDQIKKGWSSWEEAVNAKDLNIWLDKFQPAEDFTGWWTSDGGLWTLEKEKRTFDNWVKNVKSMYWEGLQPLSIKIYGDVAIAYFYAISNIEYKTGTYKRFEGKRLEVYRKMDGIWRWTDAMVSAKEIGAFVEVKE